MKARAARERLIVLLGVALLAGYLAQGALGLAWPALTRLQACRDYKLVSGLALAGYLWFQWRLPRQRAMAPAKAVPRHRLVGALAPVVLYLHARGLGAGYLVWLAAIYLGGVLVGLLHGPIVGLKRRWLFTTWFVLHLALAVILVVLGAYHVAIAVSYR